MGDLLLVRHGETEWALSGRHTSWTDVPLTENGREQARKLAPLVRSYHIGAVFSSPMVRAHETAKLTGLGNVRVDADLCEWDYGAYEGVTTLEIQRTRPDWFLFTDGVAPGPRSTPARARKRWGRGPTACSRRWTPRSRRTRAASSSSATATFRGSSPRAGSACPRRTGRTSCWRRARSAG